MPKIARHVTTILLMAALASCASSQSPVDQHLDPLTGVTVTRASAPIVFFRDNSALAAYARDYVYLGPLEVNRMGSHQYYLWLGIWSTMREGRDDTRWRDGFESVTLFADGEPMPLEIAGWTAESIGMSEHAYVKPVASAMDAYYLVTIDQIRLIAEASDLRLRAGASSVDSYLPWESGASGIIAIRQFMSSNQD